MWETAFSIVAGAILAILITIVVEAARRPKLRPRIAPVIDAPYPEDRPAKRGQVLTVDLVNDSLPLCFRWMSRSPALQCSGTISFHQLDGQRFFKDAMPMRFARSLQPIPMEIVLGEVRGFVVDPMRLSVDSRIDVYPGESTPIDIAVKFDSEDECYGWSNLSYFSDPPWRHPDWKLPKGRYLITVAVSSSGQKCTSSFRLFNDAGPKDFRLEAASASDKVSKAGVKLGG